MKRIIAAAITVLLAASSAHAWLKDYGFQPMHQKIHYKEDFYLLYTEWLYSDLDSISRNIWFLELATVVPYDEPIKALLTVTNEFQYAKYRDLLMMDICRLLTKAYIDYANQFMKEHIYFFNKDYGTNYLEGYAIAEKYYNDARGYWDRAVSYAKSADAYKGYFLDGEFNGHHLKFEDTLYRIKYGDLNYYKVIASRLRKIEENRKEIQKRWGPQ